MYVPIYACVGACVKPLSRCSPWIPVQNAALIKVPMRDEKGRSYATGRRKTAAARVWVARGDGKITVNGMDFVDYFPRVSHRVHCLDPLVATQSVGAFDVWLTVEGGGLSGNRQQRLVGADASHRQLCMCSCVAHQASA